LFAPKLFDHIPYSRFPDRFEAVPIGLGEVEIPLKMVNDPPVHGDLDYCVSAQKSRNFSEIEQLCLAIGPSPNAPRASSEVPKTAANWRSHAV